MYNSPKPPDKHFSMIILVVLIFIQSIFPQQKSPKNSSLEKTLIFKNCQFVRLDKKLVGIASDNNGALYLSQLEGKFISISSTTFEKLWETDLVGEIVSDALVVEENIYIVSKKIDDSSTRNGIENVEEKTLVLQNLDKTTGVIRWQSLLSARASNTSEFNPEKIYLYNADDAVVLVHGEGDIWLAPKTGGEIFWRKYVGSGLSSRPIKILNEIVFGTVDMRITNLFLADWTLTRRFELNERLVVLAADATGANIYTGDAKGFVRSFNKTKKSSRWSVRLGAEISSLTLTLEGLLVSSFDNFIRLFSVTNGKLIWKKRLSDRLAAAPQIRDNFAVIFAIDADEALIIELKSGKVVSKITLDSENFFTGSSTQFQDLIIFSTRLGLYSFSAHGDTVNCRSPQNQITGVKY